MGMKYLIIYTLVRFEDNKRVAFKTALSLIQIGEFSLAILELARSENLINSTYSQILIITIVISMIMTPIILKNLSRVAYKLIPDDIMAVCDTSNIDENTKNHILVLGYGRLGQAITKKLKDFGLDYVILEHNLKYYQLGVKRAEPIVFGNAAQKHILNSVNITEASAVVVAITNPDALYIICEAVDELTHNSKTIVTLKNKYQEKILEGLHLEHIIIEGEQIAKAVLDEIMMCEIG